MNIQEIKEKMKSRGITQIKLSELSGIPLQTLRKIFAGITPTPRIDTVEAIEKALHIDSENERIKNAKTPNLSSQNSINNYEETNMSIEEIKKIMKMRGISQIELAEKSGIPLSTIRRIFAGITPCPRIDTMQAIEKALDLDIQAPPTLSEAEQRLLSAFRSLEPQMQEIILNLVDNSVRGESKKNSS